MKEYRIVFVCGALRSGTTVTRLILDSHSRISCPFEFDFALDFAANVGHVETRGYVEWLATHRIFHDSGLSVRGGVAYRDLVRDFLDQVYRRTGKPLVGGVVHRNFDLLGQYWPEADFVHLVRDPRDVARSTMEMGWSGNYWYAGDHWVNTERSWDRLQREIQPDRFIEVKYEDAVGKPVETFSALCKFLGVLYEPAMLEIANASSYSYPDPRYASRWRHACTARQLRLIEGRAGDLLESRGYSRAITPREPPGTLYRAALGCQNKIHRHLNRVRRLGLSLAAGEIITRRLRLASTNRRLKARIDAIVRTTLK
jgi:hypothetical protein